MAGWRREKVPSAPTGTVVTQIPDWICEIISPSNASNDTITKLRAYHQAQVGHYWLIDPINETLAVYRFTKDGYLHVLGAKRSERVKAEPFDAIELQVGVFFRDDEDEERAPQVHPPRLFSWLRPQEAEALQASKRATALNPTGTPPL